MQTSADEERGVEIHDSRLKILRPPELQNQALSGELVIDKVRYGEDCDVPSRIFTSRSWPRWPIPPANDRAAPVHCRACACADGVPCLFPSQPHVSPGRLELNEQTRPMPSVVQVHDRLYVVTWSSRCSRRYPGRHIRWPSSPAGVTTTLMSMISKKRSYVAHHQEGSHVTTSTTSPKGKRLYIWCAVKMAVSFGPASQAEEKAVGGLSWSHWNEENHVL